MASTPSCRAGSRTREGAPARRRGRLCSGALVAPVLAALCCLLPGLAREAAAQQSAAIQVTATVASSYSTYRLRPDSAATPAPAPERNVERLAILGVGVLQVEGAAGAQVRLAPPAPDGLRVDWLPQVAQAAGVARPASGRLVQADIAYVAN